MLCAYCFGLRKEFIVSMNKIFKVVWSKSKQCYVVVSEMAKNNSGKKRVLASVLAALAVVSAGGVWGALYRQVPI